MTADLSLAVDDIRSFVGAKDFDQSRDFYVALGWKVTFDSDDLRLMELGNYRFYLQKYYQKQWCENTMLHISVRDVDAWHGFVTKAFQEHQLDGCGRISGLPKDEGYARVFHVWDPSGALIHFAQFSD